MTTNGEEKSKKESSEEESGKEESREEESSQEEKSDQEESQEESQKEKIVERHDRMLVHCQPMMTGGTVTRQMEGSLAKR